MRVAGDSKDGEGGGFVGSLATRCGQTERMGNVFRACRVGGIVDVDIANEHNEYTCVCVCVFDYDDVDVDVYDCFCRCKML